MLGIWRGSGSTRKKWGSGGIVEAPGPKTWLREVLQLSIAHLAGLSWDSTGQAVCRGKRRTPGHMADKLSGSRQLVC
eukprot:1138763-Pelagomonas_calceolata.AAC.12